MIEKDSQWILPENLKKQEEKSRELIDQGKGDTDHGDDFGAYYAYRKGINLDYIHPHATSDDSRAINYVKSLHAYLESKGSSLKSEIFNVVL
jgi:hypothetical protein